MQLGNTGLTLVKEYNSVSRSSLGRRRSYGSPSFGLRIQWQSINTIQNWSSTNRAWPLPAYSLEQRGPKHGWHHLQAPMFIYPFLMVAAGTFYSVDPITCFPSKAYAILNNNYSKNKPFRKSKQEDVCFLFLHDFVHCPKGINVSYLSQTFLDNSFYWIAQLFIILPNGVIHTFISKLCLLSKH